MDTRTIDLIGGYNAEEAKTEEQNIEALMREVDSENENEFIEAGIPFYKLSK